MADVKIDRDYVDNFAVKKFVKNNLVDEYFNDINVDLRSVGTVGFTSELMSNIGEDSFNTGSVLFRESFPNRAQIDESIYSHAAIFQLDDVFSRAASCKFLLVVEEAAILKNMLVHRDQNSRNTYYFYIDKNTTIYIEDTPFTLDYDIAMTIVKKTTDTGDDYLFTARYITEQYRNSISEVTDPYVKLRRSLDGYIALEVQAHQCTRNVVEENIITNSQINYPVVDINYIGELAGFDVLYKGPGDNDYVQMKTLIAYSQPLKNPFCYYQMIDENKIRISFNTKDTYFMPDFNSQLKVIMYITKGAAGNFDVYKGSNITLVPNNEVYSYANSYLTAAKPITASKDGQDQQGIEVLQNLAVEGYRTALALTTDNDLQVYFNNYKYRYGDADILFIKKRDDVFERIFSSFIIINNGDFIYKTNTLNLKLNLYDMRNDEKDIFMLEPGTLFTCNETDGYAQILRNPNTTTEYYSQYLEAVANGTTPFIEPDTTISEVPEYLDRACSFAQYKSRRGLDDKMKVWDLSEDDFEIYDSPKDGNFLLINPFLMKFTKNPNLVSTYMTYVDNSVAVDFTAQNSNMYLQFVLYTFYMTRKFTKDRRYDAYCKLAPTITVDDEHPLIKIDGIDPDTSRPIYHLNDRYSLADNDLRVFMCVMDANNTMLCYTEMIPTEYDEDNNNFKFESTLFTDDHISSSGKLRLKEDVIFRNDDTGEYYKVHEDDNTLYDKYDADGNVLERDIISDDVQELIDTGVLTKWQNIVNTYVYDDVLVPIDDVTVKIFTLYKRNYSETDNGLVENLSSMTNHPFMNYDIYDSETRTWKKYDKYIWTNEYSTSTYPVAFIRSLKSVRTYLDFLDYTEASESEEGDIIFAHDIFDVEMKSLSFIRAATTLDDDSTDYFFNTFYMNYAFLENIIDTRLRNQTGLDIKFYNTYGRSRDFIIGEETDILDTVNLRLSFEMWFIDGTDTLAAIPEVKRYIKSLVEVVNEKGMNNLFISNLMRKVENNFSYVDHIRFKGINAYDSNYQAIKNYVTDLNDLTVEERRWYVPELLVCDLDDIEIIEYVAK
jgi:hypothetical protein